MKTKIFLRLMYFTKNKYNSNGDKIIYNFNFGWIFGTSLQFLRALLKSRHI